MSEEDKKNKLETEFKKAISHLRMILKTYDSNRYSVKIVVVNKESWITKVEDAHASAINLMLEIQDFELTTDDEKAKLTKTIEEQEEKIIEYVTNINNKILESNETEVQVLNSRPESVSAETRAVKTARINVDIDADKISEEVKHLQVQIRKQEDWSKADSHQIEVAMRNIIGWKNKFTKVKETFYAIQ